MKGDPEFVILKFQSWLDTAKFEDKILGSMVKEFLRPTNNYAPSNPLQYNSHDLLEGTITDFVLDNSGSSSSNATASLGEIAGVSFQGAKENAVQLTGKLIRFKRLQQHDQFWAKLKKDQEVLSTVPGWISKFSVWHVCLVVGVMICEDVELSFEGKTSLDRDGHIEVPIGKITLAAGVPNPAGGGLDPKIQTGADRKTVTIFKGKVADSKIFALELKKVGLEGWFKKQLGLQSQGPKVDEHRLAAGNDEGDEEEEVAVRVEDLVLDNFDEEEYKDMT